MTALFPGAQEGRATEITPALARPGRTRWLWTLLLLPGGLLVALGLGIAWVGLVCALPGLRRIAAAWGGPTEAPEQPHGEPHEPGPRVATATWTGTPYPWVAHGDAATTTGRHWEES